MKIKDGVNINGLSSHMLNACAVVDEAFIQHTGHEVTLTSGLDGKHSEKSFHYVGLACDFRSRDAAPNALVLILATLVKNLPPPYEIINEQTHIHIEYDKKG